VVTSDILGQVPVCRITDCYLNYLLCSDAIILSSCSTMSCTVAVKQMFHFMLQMITFQFWVIIPLCISYMRLC